MTRQELSEAIALEATDVPVTMPFFLAGELLKECRRQGLKETDYTGPDYGVRVKIGDGANGIEPKSGLRTGVWFENKEFYRYRGSWPIVVRSEVVTPYRSVIHTVLSGCISCQLSRIRGNATRWLILPP